MRYFGCELALILGIAAGRLACEVIAQSPDPHTQATAERKPDVRTVRVRDIQEQQVQILGKLGCPLWKLVTVRGTWHSEEASR